MGYLSSLLLLLAGLLMIAGDQLLVGIFFLVASVAGLILRMYISKKSKEQG